MGRYLREGSTENSSQAAMVGSDPVHHKNEYATVTEIYEGERRILCWNLIIEEQSLTVCFFLFYGWRPWSNHKVLISLYLDVFLWGKIHAVKNHGTKWESYYLPHFKINQFSHYK